MVKPSSEACDSFRRYMPGPWDPVPAIEPGQSGTSRSESPVDIVGESPMQSADGAVTFARFDLQAQHSVDGHRLCLYAWDTSVVDQWNLCPLAPYEVCTADILPPYIRGPTVINETYAVDEREITVDPPAHVSAVLSRKPYERRQRRQSSEPATRSPSGSAAPGVKDVARALTRRRAISEATRALRQKYGRAYTRATRKRLTCARSNAVYRCSFSFRNGSIRRGTVTVQATPAGIETKIRITNTFVSEG
jgi:hypothetical protein